MREIQVSKAKRHFSQLLDEVERGETVVITRHNRPIARLVPEADFHQAEVSQAVVNIRAARQDKASTLTLDEILASRHEGHRY